MKIPSAFCFMSLPLATVVALAACTPVQPTASGTSVAQVYECRGNYDFLVRIEGETAHLVLPDRTATLIHQPSGAGAKYGRGDMTFWSWDDEATLEFGDEMHRGCFLNPKRDSLK